MPAANTAQRTRSRTPHHTTTRHFTPIEYNPVATPTPRVPSLMSLQTIIPPHFSSPRPTREAMIAQLHASSPIENTHPNHVTQTCFIPRVFNKTHPSHHL